VRAAAVMLAILACPPVFAQELPSGEGRDNVTTRCTVCHGTDLIAQQRLSRTAWEREIDKMVRWGASVEASERRQMLDYLSANFATAPIAAPGAAATGAEATYNRACTVCHEQDLVEAQRLTPTGWTREIEKMIRWGAAVTDSEKAPLADYLAARFPVR